MFVIAVVEDEKRERARIKEFLQRYEKERGEQMRVIEFEDAVEFLTGYKPIYDLVLMDIQMPYIDGMEAAKKLRQMDANVALVFVTNMSQYAARGYDVSAVAFLIKPVSYYSFYTLLDKVMRGHRREGGEELVVHLAEGIKVIPLDSVRYIEVRDHRLLYVTDEGTLAATGTLKALEEKLPKDRFVRCNSCYLVHLKYVKAIVGDTVLVGEDRLPVSRAKKKQFTMSVLSYFGDTL